MDLKKYCQYKDQSEEENSPRFTNNHTLILVKGQPHAPQTTPCTDLIWVSIKGFIDLKSHI